MGVGARVWEQDYRRRLLLSDAVVVLASVFAAQWLRFGAAEQDLHIEPTRSLGFGIGYTVLSFVLAACWLAALAVGGTRDPKVFGAGPAEYRRVLDMTLLVFGLFAIVGFAFRAEIGRGYLLIALPIGLVLLLLSRWLWRKRLHRERLRGRNTYRAIVVGDPEMCVRLAREVCGKPHTGFRLVGAVTNGGSLVGEDLAPGLPVVAGYDGLLDAVDAHRVDALIVTSTDSVSPERLRWLGWELESRRVDMILTLALTDIAGSRIHMRPVSGLPLIHVEHPEFTGHRLLEKRLFDLLASALLIVLLSPVLLVLALLVRLDSPGRVIFKQRRIGVGGRSFWMFKFRTMVEDAEDRLASLLDQSDGNGVLFKMKDDPRITRTGRWLRKYSVDELPQLFNVLRGEMSLVGPRPPLPAEVEQYDKWVHRRLLVKPGITGLWQVSGRSDLSWEESVRLDLYYVENWSLTSDLLILLRTVKTVTHPQGAY
ncbi:sugar transferase [Leucobacter massiliensis]|uniref:Polyprenyl glycosylphosphotransferase n=1 Tax=Leucobacter massiliensis TaxID=1686285 RepID=A0A2S9QN59_9MICO|nr:sugar transferase [Leucobacter massiliensis]PRI11017.1 polyprenyl glycosylphosphotransferase [Leucobacter massiliensis]